MADVIKGARWRLMRRRIRKGVKRVFFIALFLGLLTVFSEWLGVLTFNPWRRPRALGEIWWHLPTSAAVFFLFLPLWPYRIDFWDDT